MGHRLFGDAQGITLGSSHECTNGVTQDFAHPLRRPPVSASTLRHTDTQGKQLRILTSASNNGGHEKQNRRRDKSAQQHRSRSFGGWGAVPVAEQHLGHVDVGEPAGVVP
jgi:hypothetical protein